MVLQVKLQPKKDKICGNESKFFRTSQNYDLFQCIFHFIYICLDAAGGEGDLEMTFLDYFQIQHIETSWYL